ncbi:MAG: hypothetical protein KKC80_02970 [Candidatus Margulisbacteria bacterium]|nr:hypothetical protein [Candidatus Margulisiibacteriota bacterium]MBU1616827.1 hypothetical protein [Candidatus Margulisiibacteriota bacterium]
MFSHQLPDGLLSIKGPELAKDKGRKVIIDRSNKFGVSLTYDQLKIKANRASYDQDEIELTVFKGNYEQYALEGDYFRINPKTGEYAGDNLKFGYLSAYLKGGRVHFFGDKIVADQVTTSPLNYPVFSFSSSRIEIYPGYALARGNILKFFPVPIYYIPLYINDQRRKYFELPFPALEAAKDLFHGSHGAVHSHYFFNPQWFGDLALRYSEIDGGGVEVQQIVRLSDHQQFQVDLTGWQRASAQGKISYVYNYYPDPAIGRQLSFFEKNELAGKVAGIEAPLALRADHSFNEEINRSVIDRDYDISVKGKVKGLLFDHTYTIVPTLTYGRIRETKIYPESAPAQVVDRNYLRTGADLNFSYYLETPFIQPYVTKAFLSLDYQHDDYKPGTVSRTRLASSLTVRRPIFNLDFLFYEAVLTKSLADSGLSPFYFEEYGRLKDSFSLDLYLQTDLFVGGNQWVYDLSAGVMFNEINYLGIKALGDSYVVLRHDRRREFWELGIMKKELAF